MGFSQSLLRVPVGGDTIPENQISADSDILRIHGKSAKYIYVDVTTTLAKIRIPQSDITNFEGWSILGRCLQYLTF